MSQTDDLLTIEESIQYVRTHRETLYPRSNDRGKTLGDLPVELHGHIQSYAKQHHLKMFEVVAGLWDFYEQYEIIHEDELKTQRADTRRR